MRVARLVERIEAGVRQATLAHPVLPATFPAGSMLDWESAERSNLKERFSILNAYHLPGDLEADLADQISPVNTFRLIFSLYLGTEYARLEDQSYFSPWGRQYAFQRVTEELGAGAAADRVD
jgi:hypothetical protein